MRVGVSDYDTNNPNSRSSLIIRFIKKLIFDKKIAPYFVLADICGGDGVVCTKIKEHYPQSEIIVQDCAKSNCETHLKAAEVGVKLYGGYLQHIVEDNLHGGKLDIILMLNTFRGWHSAQLRSHEQNLPNQVLQWFAFNGRFIIVTATLPHIELLRKIGLNAEVFGKGEDDSYMVCLTGKIL